MRSSAIRSVTDVWARLAASFVLAIALGPGGMACRPLPGVVGRGCDLPLVAASSASQCVTPLVSPRVPPASVRAGPGTFHWRVGDLLFQDLDCGPLCDAIEAVTRGVAGARLSHVAMVSAVRGRRVDVLEAYSEGVAQVSLERFLARSHDRAGHPKVLVGRLVPRFRASIPAALQRGLRLLGKPYDRHFLMGNGAYYCSELIYEIFAQARAGGPLFALAPMIFRLPALEAPRPVPRAASASVPRSASAPAPASAGTAGALWARYFHRLGDAIPEGKPGINPGALSRHPALRIVFALGRPDGWRGGPVSDFGASDR